MVDPAIPPGAAPRAVGFDPGLADTGYAALEGGRRIPTVLGTGVIRTSARDPLEVRLEALFDGVRTVLERYAPDVVIIEDIFSAPSIPRTAILMGHARGVIMLVARRRRTQVREFAANRIKQSLTGHGHASKHQMQRAIQSMWNLKSKPEPADVADALAVAVCCCRAMSKSQRAGAL